MRTETTTKTIYTYDELSDRAKEAARSWFSSTVFNDSCDWEHVIDDAVHMGSLMGIEISSSPVKLYGGGVRLKPDVYFSGFCSQGDGASFEGDYRYAKGGVKAVTDECGGQDKELIRIATELQAVQKRHFYKLRASMGRGHGSNHYCHSNTMSVEVEHYDDEYRDIGDAECTIRQLMRDFADWIYERLEAEYDYQTSDEAVEEAIEANGYEFDEDGNIH